MDEYQASNRRMAELMLQQAMAGQQRQSGWGQLAPTLQMLLGAYMSQQADKQDSADLSALTSKVGGLMQGSPGETMSDAQAAALMNNDVAPQLKDPVAPNPLQAGLAAATSRFPQMQTLGQGLIKDYQKQLADKQINPLEFLKLGDFSAPSRLAASQGGGISALQPDAPKPIVANGQGFIPDGRGGYTTAFDGRDKFGSIGVLGQNNAGPIVGQVNPATGEAKYAPQGTVVSANASMPPLEREFDKAVGQGAGKALVTRGEDALKARDSYMALQQASDALDRGAFTGSFANQALGLAKIGKALGLEVDENKIQNSEAYMGLMARQVAAAASDFGTGNGFTDKDREFVQKMVAGDLTLDEGTMRHLLRLAKAASINKVLQFQQDIGSKDPAIRQQLEFPFTMRGGEGLTYDEETGLAVVDQNWYNQQQQPSQGGTTPPAMTPQSARDLINQYRTR